MHILHLSSAGGAAADRRRAARRGAGHAWRPARTTWPWPPRRSRTARRSSSAARRSGTAANRDRLWEALGAGSIDCVVSDHSPCPPELKRLAGGDFAAAWGGISSLQLALPVVWTQARGPRLLADRRGALDVGAARPGWPGWPARARSTPGQDADLVAFAPDEAFTVDPARLLSPAPADPVRRAATARGGAADLAARPAAGADVAQRGPGGPAAGARTRPRDRCEPAMTQPDFTQLARPGVAAAGRQRGGRQRRAVRREGEPGQARGRRRSPPGTSGHRGKVYDGWETRRRREPGHDYAIVRLGVPGLVHGVVVDTAWFRGNYPPEVSVEAACVAGLPGARPSWRRWTGRPLVARTAARGDTANPYPVDSDRRRWTHVRLSIYPDGGVARFRVHGEPLPDPRVPDRHRRPGRAGARRPAASDCSDAFYASAANLILPGRARGMAEGWENARRRGPGNDYAVFGLAAAGRAAAGRDRHLVLRRQRPGLGHASRAPASRSDWHELLPRTRVQPDTRHQFLVAEPGSPVSPRSAWTSSRTAAWPGSAYTASSPRSPWPPCTPAGSKPAPPDPRPAAPPGAPPRRPPGAPAPAARPAPAAARRPPPALATWLLLPRR